MKEKFTKFLVLFFSLLALNVSAQQKKISGTVTAKSDGLPIPGVSVQVKGTSLGAQTDVDGKFTISVDEGATISFAYLGFKTKDAKVGGSTVLNVALEADQQLLNEVVVTALGIKRQSRELGTSTATVSAAEITATKSTNIINGLTAKVAGLQINTVNNGVNPETRVVLRGNRSMTGNNQALIVLDGVPVPSSVLNTLNPEDVDNISILKGASAAALYGSDATNGALVVTTKKGSKTPKFTYSNSTQFENISFFPKLQEKFGLGSDEWDQVYTSYENQQYGPAFDGSLVPIGTKTADGSTQQITYIARPDERKNFFDTGSSIQNNFSISTGDEKSALYVSYQNVSNKNVVPKDKFNRNTFRLNASKEFGKFTAGFNSSFSVNNVDATANADRNNSVYWNVVNTSVLVPLTQYKDWRNDPYANPNGYYNEYYYNPYFVIDNNRLNSRDS